MHTEGRTFSESWHRVVNLHISLIPTVRVRRQWFRGEKWFVLHDPFNNRFFRLRPEAHDFVIRLNSDRTVGEIWEECLRRDPDQAPGQDAVIHLLGQLYAANLLYCALPADSAKLFERQQKQRQQLNRSRFFNLMFLRIPLFDPEPLLRRLQPLIGWLTGPLAIALWLSLAVLAGHAVIANAPALASESQALLQPDNLPLLYVGLVLVKVLHEFGHALVCKRFGGEVHAMGIMLMVFTPVPYLDATASWSFRRRRERILVAASGMVFEFFAAFCAALFWAHSGPGALHNVAFNMMFIASVSTLIFNANPLLRYDGYYILSDLLGIPNLQSRALSQLKYLGEHYLFGSRDSVSPTQNGIEAAWLTAYGLLSGLYRVLVYGGIILFVADRFLLIGLLMAAMGLFTWGIMPAARFAAYLATSPALRVNRTRAVAVSLGTLSLLLLLLATVPVPSGFRAPGILESSSFLRLSNPTPGQLEAVLLSSGSRVELGTPLVRLGNAAIDLEIAAASAERQAVLAQQKESLAISGNTEGQLLEQRLATIEQKLSKLQEQQQALIIRAPAAGRWIAPKADQMTGAWLARGSEIGVLFKDDSYRFTAVVPQEVAAYLFREPLTGPVEIRLKGEGNHPLRVTAYEFIPFQHEKLPSAALGWLAGGEVPVSGKDASGLQTVEPFFQIYAELEPSSQRALYHGQSGLIRFSLGAEPLLQQWTRQLRQLLQRRYQT